MPSKRGNVSARNYKSQIDRKENRPIDYLFMTRNQLMGGAFLNRSLIPLLCKVAGLVDESGVPLRDAVGKITSHRARSTLATWLRSNGPLAHLHREVAWQYVLQCSLVSP